MRALAPVAALAFAFVALAGSGACLTPTAPVPVQTGDAGVTLIADGGVVTCTTSLVSACASATAPGDCPPTSDGDLPGTWCASHPAVGAITGSCGGFVVLAEPTGASDMLLFVYDAKSGALSALLTSPGLGRVVCLGGAPGFSLPTGCFSDYGSDLLVAFDGPGSLPACSGLDAGSDASASASVGDGGDAGDGGP